MDECKEQTFSKRSPAIPTSNIWRGLDLRERERERERERSWANLKTLKIKLINCEQILKSRHATLASKQGKDAKDACLPLLHLSRSGSQSVRPFPKAVQSEREVEASNTHTHTI